MATAIDIARKEPMLMRPERGADMVARGTVQAFPRAAVLAIPRGRRPILQARFGRFETMRAKPAPSASFRSRATALRKYRSHPVPTRANPGDCRVCPAQRW